MTTVPPGQNDTDWHGILWKLILLLYLLLYLAHIYRIWGLPLTFQIFEPCGSMWLEAFLAFWLQWEELKSKPISKHPEINIKHTKCLFYHLMIHNFGTQYLEDYIQFSKLSSQASIPNTKFHEEVYFNSNQRTKT